MKTFKKFKLKFNATIARWSLRLIIRLKILYNGDSEKIQKALKEIDGVGGGRTIEDRRKGKDRRK